MVGTGLLAGSDVELGRELEPGQQECPRGAMQEAALLKLPRSQAPGWFGLVDRPGEGFEGGRKIRGLCGETPVASGTGHHLGYKEDLVGLLHIPPELQQGRCQEWVVWLEGERWEQRGILSQGVQQARVFSWRHCPPHPPRPPSPLLGGAGSQAPTSKSMGGVQEMLMALVWPRSTEPLEGSMVKPLCCRAAMLSMLNSTVCRHWCCQQAGGWAQLLGTSNPAPSPDQQAAHPSTTERQGQQRPELPGQWWLQRYQGGQGSAVVTFFVDSWVVRMQPTCSSRVAGGACVSGSSWA